MQLEYGQPIWNQLGSNGIGLDNVAGFAQRVRCRGGVEKRIAGTGTWVDLESGVGTPRVKPEFHHLAIAVKPLVEFHFLPVMDAKITTRRRVFATDCKV